MHATGYCWPQSGFPGDAIALYAAGSGPVDVEVVRDSGPPEVVWRAQEIATVPREVPATVVEDGCRWPAAMTIPTDPNWPSGMYVVRLRRAGEERADPATAWFVLRARQPGRSGCLVVLASNTWNAYNDFGGRNLYTGATAVSFERPLAIGLLEKPTEAGERLVERAREYIAYTARHELSTWHGMAGWAGQERRFANWAAQSGIELDFATNRDLEEDPHLLDGYRLYLSIGHDEYWSWAMRDNVERFVAAGGNAAFFSGNTCYWQVRINRSRMTCFKHRFIEDPLYGVDNARLTTMWSDPLISRPENELTGVSFTRGGYHHIFRSAPRGAGGYEVHRPDHWLLDGTGLRRGDLLGTAPMVVGYECDGCDLTSRYGLPAPTGADGTPITFEIVATAPATPFDRDTTPLPLAPGADYELEFHTRRLLGDDSSVALDRLRNGHAVMGAYERGGAVVTVGCTEWAYGLHDPDVDRITRNVIARATGLQGPSVMRTR
jgi:hypothetical protein